MAEPLLQLVRPALEALGETGWKLSTLLAILLLPKRERYDEECGVGIRLGVLLHAEEQ